MVDHAEDATRFETMKRLTLVLCLPVLLGGCMFGGAGQGPRMDLGAIDFATAVFAVDHPVSVEPTIVGPRVIYDTLDATLVRGDAEAVMGALPPPAEGRSYAVYAFAPEDQPKVRAVATGGTATAISIQPNLCLTSVAQKDRDTVTVVAVLPGRGTIVIVPPETLTELETRTGVPLTACPGHSG
jgi:hypothetical protein